MFGATVAIWFAALFGLSSLAIRPAMVESLIIATGAQHAIPAVAPPLDTAARAMIALALAVAGGLLGLSLGRMIPALVTRRRNSRSEQFPQPRRPFSAQELAEVTFDDPAPTHVGDARSRTADVTPPRERPPQVDLTELQKALLSEPLPRPVLVPAAEPAVTTFDLPAPPLGKAAQRLLAADLATLSPMELVERLALSMQCQRAAVPSDTATATAPRRMPATPLPRVHGAPVARADNEQVLRSALAALQRLSGAA